MYRRCFPHPADAESGEGKCMAVTLFRLLYRTNLVWRVLCDTALTETLWLCAACGSGCGSALRMEGGATTVSGSSDSLAMVGGAATGRVL